MLPFLAMSTRPPVCWCEQLPGRQDRRQRSGGRGVRSGEGSVDSPGSARSSRDPCPPGTPALPAIVASSSSSATLMVLPAPCRTRSCRREASIRVCRLRIYPNAKNGLTRYFSDHDSIRRAVMLLVHVPDRRPAVPRRGTSIERDRRTATSCRSSAGSSRTSRCRW